jgi:hypothetical protein
MRSDHQVLLDAIAVFEHDQGKAKAIANSVNGKVGGTLNRASGRNAVEMYQAMLHRLSTWEHAQLLEVADFRLWLAQRVTAIQTGSTKRRARRR